MAFLETFSVEERALLIALPYRAGLWISMADRSGGPQASEEERKALESVIGQQSAGMFHSAFSHEIMAELWGAKAGWGAWESDIHAVPGECREAARIVNLKLHRRDLDAYRATVMHIASAVAKAFCEGRGEHATVLTDMGLKVKLWLGHLGSALRREPYDPAAILNISPTEDKGLAILAKALSVGAEHAVQP